jgi:hypothetical protein
LGFIKSVGLHFFSLGAYGNACWGDLDVTVRGCILLAAVVQIDEGLDVLVIQKEIDRLRIMSGIEQHLIHCAQGETLLEFHRADDQTNESCLEAGCSLGYKGKSCLLSAAEIMYMWYPLKYFSLALSHPELQSGWE